MNADFPKSHGCAERVKRWPFDWRALFVVVAAIGIGWLVWCFLYRHALANRLEELGASVPRWESRWLRDTTINHREWHVWTKWCHICLPDAKLVFSLSDPLPDPEAVAELLRRLSSIECVFLMDESMALPRPVLEALCDCPEVGTLAVVQVPFSRSDWKVLSRAKSIRTLEIESTTVDDDILNDLTSLKSLEVMSLTDLPLTSKAVGTLKAWPRLKTLWVDLDDSALTREKIRAELPGIDVR